MDVPRLIRERLVELGLEQKDLARAAGVTDSYISQLLGRKKIPPSPKRSEIYEKIGSFLGLPYGELRQLAESQRQREWLKQVSGDPRPLFAEARTFMLRKCRDTRREELRSVFTHEAFGDMERLVLQTLLHVSQAQALKEKQNEKWVNAVASRSGCSVEATSVGIEEFLTADLMAMSNEGHLLLLDLLVESWDFDLKRFQLNVNLSQAQPRQFQFRESFRRTPNPGLDAFLKDTSLSTNITSEELTFLQDLQVPRPGALPIYFYRELQNLRDSHHFLSEKELS